MRTPLATPHFCPFLTPVLGLEFPIDYPVTSARHPHPCHVLGTASLLTSNLLIEERELHSTRTHIFGSPVLRLGTPCPPSTPVNSEFLGRGLVLRG
ncbi:hypothetical protein OH77DRAFT_629082 [Trametes cingulata]|nr:hypothetical protein OH77DRAFT_629082 [Trametes cingulata]